MSKNLDNNSPDRLNRIVEGTSVEGEIKSDSNIRIDGKVKGTIITKGRLVIGPKGVIEGDVTCENADIEGQLLGKIKITQLLTLKSTAKLSGDIITNKLAIEPGAAFSGSCSMGNEPRTQSPSSEKVSQNGQKNPEEQRAFAKAER